VVTESNSGTFDLFDDERNGSIDEDFEDEVVGGGSKRRFRPAPDIVVVQIVAHSQIG
jgi:hypothetical protein